MIEVLSQFSKCVERASIDEAYIDLTEEVNRRIEEEKVKVLAKDLSNTHVSGFDDASKEDKGKFMIHDTLKL